MVTSSQHACTEDDFAALSMTQRVETSPFSISPSVPFDSRTHCSSVDSPSNPFEPPAAALPSYIGSSPVAPLGLSSGDSPPVASLSPFGDGSSPFASSGTSDGRSGSPFMAGSNPFGTSPSSPALVDATAPASPFATPKGDTENVGSVVSNNPFETAPNSDAPSSAREECSPQVNAPISIRRAQRKREAERGKIGKKKKQQARLAVKHLGAFLKSHLVADDINAEVSEAAKETPSDGERVWSSVANVSSEQETLTLVRSLIDEVSARGESLPPTLGRCVLQFVLLLDEAEGRPLLKRLVPCVRPYFCYAAHTSHTASANSREPPPASGLSRSRDGVVLTGELMRELPMTAMVPEDIECAPCEWPLHPLHATVMRANRFWALEVFCTVLSPAWEMFFLPVPMGINVLSLLKIAFRSGVLKNFCELCPLALPLELRLQSDILEEFPTSLFPWVWETIASTSHGPNDVPINQALVSLLIWAGTDSRDRAAKDGLFADMLSWITPAQVPLIEPYSPYLLLRAIQCQNRTTWELLWPQPWVLTQVESSAVQASLLIGATDAGMLEAAVELLQLGSVALLLTPDSIGNVPLASLLGKRRVEEWALEILHGKNGRFPIGEQERTELFTQSDAFARAIYIAATSGRVTVLEELLDIVVELSRPVSTVALSHCDTPLSEEVDHFLGKGVPHQFVHLSGQDGILDVAFSNGLGQNVVAILEAVPDYYDSSQCTLVADVCCCAFKLKGDQWKKVLACFELCPAEVFKTNEQGVTLLHVAAAYFPVEGIEVTREMVPASMTSARSASNLTPWDMVLARTNLSEDDVRAIRDLLAASTTVKRASP